MPLHYDARLKPFARNLRSNLTDAERRLWQNIRGKQIRGVQFYRQKPIGPYIVDFYAPVMRLMVEVDGDSHYDDEAVRADKRRTLFLNRQGLKVIRFTNIDVMQNLAAVLEVIYAEVSLKIPPDPPSPKGGNSSKGGSGR
jgi:very-short-patch-repair endonuclease